LPSASWAAYVLELERVGTAALYGHRNDITGGEGVAGDLRSELLVDEQARALARCAAQKPLVDQALAFAGALPGHLLDHVAVVERKQPKRALVADLRGHPAPPRTWWLLPASA
jgi:hypothetical protein